MLEKAKEQAMKYLLIRMRSEKEIRQYLQKKQYDETIIEEVVDYLYAYNYLDDLKFCELYLSSCINSHKPCGRSKLRYELKNKGVAAEIIDQALEDYFPYETELEMALALAQKKAAQNLPPHKIRQHLAYKGYDFDLIDQVMYKTNEYVDEFSERP